MLKQEQGQAVNTSGLIDVERCRTPDMGSPVHTPAPACYVNSTCQSSQGGLTTRSAPGVNFAFGTQLRSSGGEGVGQITRFGSGGDLVELSLARS